VVGVYPNFAPATSYIVGQMLDNSRLSPPETVVGNLFFLNVFDEGQAYTEQEHRDWLADAGFKQCERLLLPNKMSIMSAKKPREGKPGVHRPSGC
jgi:hypothetical protein